MNLKRATFGPLLSVAFLLAFVYMIIGVQKVLEKPDEELFLGSISSNTQSVVTKNVVVEQPIVKLDLNAESAISVETNLKDKSKIIFEKKSNAILPIASLTKLMTAIIVLDNYNLSDITKIKKIVNIQDPEIKDVKLGDTMSVEDFLNIMLVGSSNSSAYALSEMIGQEKFVELMNQKAKGLGLQNTFFKDSTGLSSENVSTVVDIAEITGYVLNNYPEIAEITTKKEIYLPSFGTFENTDKLLQEVPEIVCGKTGITAQAKGCLVLAVKNPKNNDFIINVILGSDDRFSEMEKLINWSNTICK